MPMFGGKRRKKKDSSTVPNLPKVDLALTLACHGILLHAAVRFAQLEGSHVLVELLGFMVATGVAIAACKTLGPLVGRPLSTQAARKSPRNLRKFSDQSWQLVVHVGMTWYEWQLLEENKWEWWNNSTTMWSASWQHSESETCPASLRRLYLLQLAIWYVTAFSHKHIEAKHNDYFVMYAHHAATLGLVSLSYFNNWQPIGLLTLFIHDSSDIVVDALKMVNYLGLDASSGLFLAEIAFAMNLFTWAWARMYYFVTRVIRSTLPINLVAPGWGDYPFTNHAFISPQNACRALLASLACMHIYWYGLFIKILVRLLAGSDGHDAGREYEGSSDSEREDEGDTQATKKDK